MTSLVAKAGETVVGRADELPGRAPGNEPSPCNPGYQGADEYEATSPRRCFLNPFLPPDPEPGVEADAEPQAAIPARRVFVNLQLNNNASPEYKDFPVMHHVWARLYLNILAYR
jgi:hypothetical protein